MCFWNSQLHKHSLSELHNSDTRHQAFTAYCFTSSRDKDKVSVHTRINTVYNLIQSSQDDSIDQNRPFLLSLKKCSLYLIVCNLFKHIASK